MALSRSAQMARIHGEDTSPERVLCAALSARGVAFDTHTRTPVGRPDIVLAANRIAIFIDGCFWHGCPSHYVRPRTRSEFWSAKLVENVERDCKQTRQLEDLGWRVVRAWEHEVFVSIDDVLQRVDCAIRGAPDPGETSWRVRRVEVIDAATDLECRHMVSLREPLQERTIETKRMTTKWKSPKTRTRKEAADGQPPRPSSPHANE